eukprot:scaffold278037_cov22-Tisochrysis_lutea.AAC.1
MSLSTCFCPHIQVIQAQQSMTMEERAKRAHSCEVQRSISYFMVEAKVAMPADRAEHSQDN